MFDSVAPKRRSVPSAQIVAGLVILVAVAIAVWLPLSRLDLIVKLLVGFSWPLAVLVVAWWFKPEIGSKLRDLLEIGKTGLKFGPPTQVQAEGDPASPGLISSNIGSSQPALTAEAAPLRPQDTVAPVYQPLVASVAAKVEERLASAKQASGRTEAELLRALVCDSAAALLLERGSRTIFKSQLDALDGLKSASSITVSDFRPYYDRTLAKQNNYPFEAWLGFMSSFELIVVSEESVTITEAGRVIGHYMAERGYGRGVEEV
jgi:hypothetical protein